MEALAEAPISPDVESIDSLEQWLARFPQQRLPLNHIFVPGLYARECFLPKGTHCVTKIHKTEHVFVISRGSVSVWTKEEGVVHYAAPHTGVTKPGTRRLIVVHEDTIWSTFHPTTETDLQKIEEQLIEPHDYPFEIDALGFSKLKETCIQ